MKLKIANIKLNDREHTEPNVFNCHVPTREHYETMIGWLNEYDINTEHTAEQALLTYIRTLILYGQTKIDYDVFVLTGQDAAKVTAVDTTEPICVDMLDQDYSTYELISFDLQLPAELIIDDNSVIFADYDETLDQFIFEAMISCLQMKITNIR